VWSANLWHERRPITLDNLIAGSTVGRRILEQIEYAALAIEILMVESRACGLLPHANGKEINKSKGYVN